MQARCLALPRRRGFVSLAGSSASSRYGNNSTVPPSLGLRRPAGQCRRHGADGLRTHGTTWLTLGALRGSVPAVAQAVSSVASRHQPANRSVPDFARDAPSLTSLQPCEAGLPPSEQLRAAGGSASDPNQHALRPRGVGAETAGIGSASTRVISGASALIWFERWQRLGAEQTVSGIGPRTARGVPSPISSNF